MKELFIKFKEPSYRARNAPSPYSSNQPTGPLLADLLLVHSQQELFADYDEGNFFLATFDGRLSGRRPPDDARALLLSALPPEAQGAVFDATETTRLRIVSGMPPVDAMPWEALNGKGNGGGSVGVTRLVPVLLPPPPLSTSLPLKILLVVTNPRDDRLLDPNREVDAITANIDQQKYQVQLLTLATREEAVNALRNFQPHIFHYVGHSGVVRGAGALVLHEPSMGTTDWISAAEIAAMLPISTRLVCLSTCFTQSNYNVRGLSLLAHAPQSVKLPTCIANRAEVAEPEVRSFWSGFYSALVANLGNVEEAFFAAQTPPIGVALSGSNFSLVLRDGGAQPLKIATNVDQTVFVEQVQAQFASRLAAELNEKLKSFGSDAPKSLIDSVSDAQNRFSEIASRAAKIGNE
jgi:hypothetical protein